MSDGIYIAAAGAMAQSTALDATANNIANASTVGFHGDRVLFKEALGKARSVDTTLVDNGTQRVDSEPGALTQTDNPLDCALDGDGMFAVNTPQGERYTRAGNFQLDDKHQIVASDGSPVRGQGGAAITVPEGANLLAVGADGSVSADGVTIGKLELARFASGQLKREGGTLYAATGKPLAGDPPKVRSGMLESSNVNVVRGVVDLVKVSRTYESLMKVIQGYSDIDQRAAKDLGGPK